MVPYINLYITEFITKDMQLFVIMAMPWGGCNSSHTSERREADTT